MMARVPKAKVNAVKDAADTSGISADHEAANAQLAMVSDMLETVNAKLAETLAELEVVKQDLQKMIELTQTAAVFVDRQLHVRRFTPSVTAIYKLRPSDIGRPLSDVPANFVYRELETDFKRVDETKAPFEKQIETADGKGRFIMRILPYTAHGDTADGAAIVFAQVDS